MISKLLDWFSEFLARRKGLLPLIGIVLVIINFICCNTINPNICLYVSSSYAPRRQPYMDGPVKKIVESILDEEVEFIAS